MRPLFLFIVLAFTLTLRAEDQPAPFEIKEGDRVLFLGDVLLEREGTYGYLETRMQEQFPDRHFTVRNLSFSGDTPLGWSRASFDPPAKGFDRLKEQLALVKPTVVFLGYGMAASLQEMTDRSGDITLNRDVERYGTEPYSAARFKKELGQCMDAIKAVDPATKVRFVLLSPIRHEDLRKEKPGMPDPTEHNKLLEQYSKVIEELATERGSRFVDIGRFMAGSHAKSEGRVLFNTDNGIHLNEGGNQILGELIADELGAKVSVGSHDPTNTPQIRAAIIKKNELFFHRWRPENHTYLFGFRKHEQGQNAKEIPEFDPLIDAAEAEIDKIKRAPKDVSATTKAPATPSLPAPPDTAPLPLPQFDLDPALEISLWAETPLLAKPTEMNWDAAGRLWVCSSGLYPMIAPGGEATDKVLVLEDPDHVGHATKSTVFAEGLLVPTGVEADFLSGRVGVPPADLGVSPKSSPKASGGTPDAAGGTPTLPETRPNACYVGASTELLRFEDTDGDGHADTKRIVLSGFGTEDTHHILHTLRWGPDGRLYFDQSIYIHSHLETPWGMVRMNSGAVMAYDPRTERVEVCYKGFCNPWGHAWDKWGQEFITDGAGFQGISWGILGAQYFTYENGKHILQSISPGNYPKFASLELIQSPHFPADWQGDAITCDFRAHRIVRFHINDLATGDVPKSGYVTKEMPDICRTGDVSFRPIDVKLGPDGALYVADWSNPVINHGEVDFRDPRRDHVHGRIWRISVKGSAPVKWEPLAGKKTEELLEKLLSENQWEKQQARRVLDTRGDDVAPDAPGGDRRVSALAYMWSMFGPVRKSSQSGEALLESIQLVSAVGNTNTIGPLDFIYKGGKDEPWLRAAAIRAISRRMGSIPRRELLTDMYTGSTSEEALLLMQLGTFCANPSPRVRIEVMRALCRISTPKSASLVLETALNAPKEDPFYAYAAAMSINDLAEVWTTAISKGEWVADSPEKQQQLAWGLANIRADLASATLAKLVANNKVPLDGSGPWIELIGQSGGPAECSALLNALYAATTPDSDLPRALADGKYKFATKDANRRAAAALVVAANRGVVPGSDPHGGWQFFHYAPDEAAADVVRLAGLWKEKGVADAIAARLDRDSSPPMLDAVFATLRILASDEAARTLIAFLDQPHDGKADSAFLRMALQKNNPAIRCRALGALAAFRPDEALAALKSVLTGANDEAQLALWRELLQSPAFSDKLIASLRKGELKDLPKTEIALRAAREAGQKGQPLANLLAGSPAPGKPMPRDVKADIKHFTEMAVTNGHPIDGEAVYHRIGCVQCHSIGGAGGKFGPDFTSLGASAPLDYIVESIFDPAAKVKEGYIAFAFTMKDGSQMNGIPSRETATEQFIRVGPGPEIALAKANIAKRDSIGSMMPAGLTDALNDEEKLNLISFVSQIGKPGPFDASKATVARAWWLFPSSTLASAVTPGSADAPAVVTNVNGALPKQRLADALPLVANAGDGPKAATKFQLATAGKVKLNLTGIRDAWLDGQGLAVASEPSPTVDLPAGVHTLAVRLDPKALPETLRVESGDVRFLTE